MPNYNDIYHIAMIGDSITQLSDQNNGFSAILRDRYSAQAMITNIALSGGNTGTGKTHLQYKGVDTFLPNHIDKAFVMFGANDDMYGIEKPKSLPKRRMGVSKQQFAQLYETVYDEFSKYAKEVVFIATPPISPSYNWDRLHEQTEEYADIVHELGKKLNVTVLDVRTKAKITDAIWSDGLHFNNLGNTIAANLMQDNIGNLPKFRRDWMYFIECRDVNSYYDKISDKCQCKKTFVAKENNCECDVGFAYDDEKDQCIQKQIIQNGVQSVSLGLAILIIAVCCGIVFLLTVITINCWKNNQKRTTRKDEEHPLINKE